MKDKELNQLTNKMFANIMNWFQSEEKAEVVTIDLQEFLDEHADDAFKIIAAIMMSSLMAVKEIAQMGDKTSFIDVQTLMNKVLLQVLVNEKTK